MLRINNLKLAPTTDMSAQQEIELLKQKSARFLRIKEEQIKALTIFKKSLDARKKTEVRLVYTINLELASSLEAKLKEKKLKNTEFISSEAADLTTYLAGGKDNMRLRPVIVGMGPAGMFAGLLLARSGYKPIILEQGAAVEERSRKVSEFWRQGLLDPRANVQFGEGGAGTFSDGKLTTRIGDIRCRWVLQEFIRAGAQPEIIYKNKPHIGTDVLRKTVKNIREEIITCGGQVRFKAQVSDVIIENGAISALVINEEETLPAETVLLAIGGSARNTFALLAEKQVRMLPKAFSVGVRVEHPQNMINHSQYGQPENLPGWGPADYSLVYHAPNGRSAYTFCMCPGGLVVAASSDTGEVVTNGMSFSARNGENANAAVLVGVKPQDFANPENPLSGVDFQRQWERCAYRIGGESYHAPAQLLEDFMMDRVSTGAGEVLPTYRPGVTWSRLAPCLPAYVIETLQAAFTDFGKKIKGFDRADAILTGVETRSSSPLRILRDKNGRANIAGLYPMGEGAGYAGGIMSSAVDGIKTAEKIMTAYAPPDIRC